MNRKQLLNDIEKHTQFELFIEPTIIIVDAVYKSSSKLIKVKGYSKWSTDDMRTVQKAKKEIAILEKRIEAMEKNPGSGLTDDLEFEQVILYYTRCRKEELEREIKRLDWNVKLGEIKARGMAVTKILDKLYQRPSPVKAYKILVSDDTINKVKTLGPDVHKLLAHLLEEAVTKYYEEQRTTPDLE